MKNLFKLYKYLDNYLWKLVAVIVVSTTVAIMQSLTPLIVSKIITIITTGTKSGQVTMNVLLWLLVILLAGLAENIAKYHQDKIQARMGLEVATLVRARVFRMMLNLSPAYTESEGAGKIMQRINEGVGNFRNWLGQSTFVISHIVFLVIAFAVIFTKSITAGLIFCAFFGPFTFYTTVRKIRLTRPIMRRQQEAGGRSNGLLTEVTSNLAMVKSLSAEDTLNNMNDKNMQAVYDLSLQSQNIQIKYNTARDISSSLYQFIAIGIATISAVYGKLSPADIFVFAYFASSLTNSINPIARTLDTTTEADVYAARLVEFLESAPITKDRADALPLVKLESIEFKNVSFTYPDGKKNKGAINNISFKIEGDKTVALVGPSGTGKSTITKLLLRFYEPTKGEILVNGHDVRDFTADSIRQHIGMVMQDVALFNATVEENLAMANARADKAAIVHAAKQAHADEFIQELPKKYKTLVGERGVKLSGGQKQRVAIARAILKDPQLIILDEATSALDSESERLVQAGLSKLMAGRSALVIAHRLSTIMHADEILVLKNGKVAERGNHFELINQTGLYKKLFDLQSSSGKVKL